jgi:hypothetical protein
MQTFAKFIDNDEGGVCYKVTAFEMDLLTQLL